MYFYILNIRQVNCTCSILVYDFPDPTESGVSSAGSLNVVYSGIVSLILP